MDGAPAKVVLPLVGIAVDPVATRGAVGTWLLLLPQLVVLLLEPVEERGAGMTASELLPPPPALPPPPGTAGDVVRLGE